MRVRIAIERTQTRKLHYLSKTLSSLEKNTTKVFYLADSKVNVSDRRPT
jgi:hypothetical protein